MKIQGGHGKKDRLAQTSHDRVHVDEDRSGPQKNWLHRLGRAEDSTCQCGHHLQNGHHITFDCPRLDEIRKALLGHRKTWVDLDSPNWY